MATEDLDTYDLDLSSDDPFDDAPAGPGSSSPERNPPRKRKRTGSQLGLDEEIAIGKRRRGPAAKLDEARLLSDAGIPKLRRLLVGMAGGAGKEKEKGKGIEKEIEKGKGNGKESGNDNDYDNNNENRHRAGPRFKGRGHEFGDAARLLVFYQLWLDDLFPKARFLDALAVVEKLGHKKTMIRARMEWLQEGRGVVGDGTLLDDEDRDRDRVVEGAASSRPVDDRTTQPRHDSVPPDEDDLYGSTPPGIAAAAGPLGSIFGNWGTPCLADKDEDEEDLDALMAMEEAERADEAGKRPDAPAEIRRQQPGPAASVTQNPPQSAPHDDFADDEAAMAEMDAW